MRFNQRSISKDTAYYSLKLFNGQAKATVTQLLVSYSLLTLELGFIKLTYTFNSHDMSVSYSVMNEQASIHFLYKFFNLGLDLTMLSNSCTNLVGIQAHNLFVSQRYSQKRWCFKIVSSINYKMKVKMLENMAKIHYLTCYLSKKQSICLNIVNQLIASIYLIVLIKFIWSNEKERLTKLVCNLLINLDQLLNDFFSLNYSSVSQYGKTIKETELTFFKVN